VFVVTITRVHHLNCATLQGGSLRGSHLVCHVALLETSTAGLVLIDTGLGSAEYADLSSRLGFGFARVYSRPKLDPSLAAIEQIRQRGFSPADVRHIVLTHLDLDHVGGLSDFPDASVHVHETELQAAHARAGLRGRLRYRPQMWAHGPEWRTYRHAGEPWLGFEAVRGLADLDDDILMVPLFGHSSGHVGVAVDTADGWLLAAGDAYFDQDEIKLPERVCDPKTALFQIMVAAEDKSSRHNQDRLRALHAEHPDVEIFCAHDPTEYLDLVRRCGESPRGVSPRLDGN
jgi:glyoxylase-like metal-dependent hydrolase (beta-lactamase superfamily II)